MTENDIETEIEHDRRTFIKKVLGGTITGSLLLVIPAISGQFIEEVPGKHEKTDLFPDKRFVFVVDITACIGCGSCCVADKVEYDVPDGHCRSWVERYIIDDEDTVYVDTSNGGLGGCSALRKGIPHQPRDIFFVPKLCNMCEKPSCVEVCPVGATYKTIDGFILIDNTRCVGCSSCIQACPYSARFINPRTGTAEKCSWCYHRVRKGLLPACVTVCPVHARKFGDFTDRNSEIRKILQEFHVISGRKPDTDNKPTLHYVGLRKEVI